MDILLIVVITVQVTVGTGVIKKGYFALNKYYPNIDDVSTLKIGRLNKVGTSKPILILTVLLYTLVMFYNRGSKGATEELLVQTCILSTIYNGVYLVGSFLGRLKEKGCWVVVYYLILTLAYGFTYVIILFKHLTNIF